MNKYLLLRDNKQSGPYTVPEIVAMGLKPYDLVWLEGKSAAWRYPSEVDELKAYAPAVEEQPFDRFYKKPQANKSDETPKTSTVEKLSEPNTAYERYQPKVAANPDEERLHRKVYINFPGAGNSRPAIRETAPVASVAAAQEKPAVKTVNEVLQSQTQTTSLANHTSSVTDNLDNDLPLFEKKTFSAGLVHERQVKKSNNNLLRGAIAACVVLGLITGFMFFNYYRQQKAIAELNSLVQQIENNKRQQAGITTSLVQTDAPPPAIPEQPADIPAETNPVNETPVTKSTSPQKSPKASAGINKPEEAQQTAAVVFSENGRPVMRRDEAVESPAKASEITSSENLFKLVDVKPNEYKTGLLGGISNLKFEITNKSNVELQRVAVEVKYLGPEKKVVKKQTVYFENVAPGAHNTIEVPKSNRGVSIEYTVTDIKS